MGRVLNHFFEVGQN